MKTARIAACVAGAGALIGLAGCCSLFWHPGCAPKIVTQPKSQLIKKGSPVTFSVTTYPTTNVYYQWRFNNVDIAGANTSSYTIPSVDFINVGAYDVLVWGSPTNTSKPAYLSVYTLTSGSGGTLATPIGAYSSQSFTCPSGGTFNKGFCVTNNQTMAPQTPESGYKTIGFRWRRRAATIMQRGEQIQSKANAQ